MQTLVSMLLGNAIVAGALAITAILAMRLRRPALAHALWVLVLIKLVTPPVWEVGIPVPQWDLEKPVEVVQATASIDTPPIPTGERAVPFPAARPELVEGEKDGGEGVIEADLAPILVGWELPSLSTVLGMTWLAGSLLWIGFIAIRIYRFNRISRAAIDAPAELQQRADVLARALELRRSPPILLIPGNISPMLWHDIRSTRLMIPKQLLHSLDPEQQDALLLHELAHLKRKDHLTRWLEVVVTAILWWHPLVWIARRGLREAEEQCCDAWVIWTMPGSARRYADALVDTLDFLAASPQSLPPGASGLGGLHSLQRRLTMIFTHTPPRRMSGMGRIAVLGLIGLLPLGLVRGQQPQLTVPAEPGAPAAVRPLAPATGPATAPAGAIDPTTIPQEQLIVLRSISTNGRGGHVAMLLNVATGEMRGFEGAGRIANGGITSVTVQGVQFLKDGAAASLLISPGMNLEGVAIGGVEPYRQRLLGTAEPLPPSRRGGGGGGGRRGSGAAAQNNFNNRIENQFQGEVNQFEQRRAQELGLAAPVAAAPPDKVVVLALIEGMADPDPNVSHNARQALASFGTAAVPIYVEAMSSDSAVIRQGALSAISGVVTMLPGYTSMMAGRRGGRGGRSGGFSGGRYASPSSDSQTLELQALIAPAAVKALDDSDAGVRQRAGELVTYLIDQPQIVVPALARMLGSEDRALRLQALEGLRNNVRFRGADRIAEHLPAVIKLLADRDITLRGNAISLLGECGPAARSAVPELLKAMKDEDAVIRATAATALGQIQVPTGPPVMGNDAQGGGGGGGQFGGQGRGG